MRLKSLAYGLIVCALLMSTAQAVDDIEQKLNDSYKGKSLVLRNFYSANKLSYNTQGELIGSSAQVPWTLSRVMIKAIQVKPGRMRIEGERAGDLFDNSAKKFVIMNIRGKVRIEVELPAGASETEVVSLFRKILFVDRGPLMAALPAHWRAYFERQDNPEARPDVSIANPGGPAAYKVGGGITAPRVVYAPDPQYPEPARQARVQGTCVLWVVIDTQGNPKDIAITRPLGMGLDDSAAATVSRWRFDPAKLNGKAVPVQINVEVNFRLY